MKPWEFAALTPGEFRQMVTAVIGEREHQRELVAWAVAHLMNSSGNLKRSITVADLLGPEYQVKRLKEKKVRRGVE